MDTDGRVLELGRGGMGVTYKALDVALQIPVTLKLIGEKLEEAISLANELKDEHALTVALGHAEIEGGPVEVERLASLIVEVSARDNFAQCLAEGAAVGRAALRVTVRKVSRRSSRA